MFKNSSAKYHQENKKDYKKKKNARERYQSLSKEEKEKSDSIVMNDTKI